MDSKTNRAIGAALQKARKKQGLTQAEVAIRYGVPQSFISKLELGERNFMYWEVFVYAYALELPAEDLFHTLKKALVELVRDELDVKAGPAL